MRRIVEPSSGHEARDGLVMAAAGGARVNVNPASDVLGFPEGAAREAALAGILWWKLRGHRAPPAEITEDRPLLAPQSCLLQVTLSAIGLRAVPHALSVAPLPAIHKLDLSLNNITSLADSNGGLAWLVTGLPHIAELNLANNRLSRVPAELGELKSLRVLRLGGNDLCSLPAELSQLTEMRELYIHDNSIAGSGECLEQILPAMLHLEVLDINHNLMTKLPDALLCCVNLLKLNADNNSLSMLPCAPEDPLDFQRGLVKEVHHREHALRARAMGHRLPKLQRFYLANNEFEGAPYLGRQLALAMPSLRVCDVSSNYGDPSDAANAEQHLVPAPEGLALLEQEHSAEAHAARSTTNSGDDGQSANADSTRCNLMIDPILFRSAASSAASYSMPWSAPHHGPSGSTVASPPIPKLCRNLVRAGRYVEALKALSGTFFRGFTEQYVVNFDVQPVLRRRGVEGEGYLAALTGRHGRTSTGQWEYNVTFKANTLVRTSFAGLVRQLGHEFEHVKQFEAGVYDFARQEFLAYGWMLEGADPEASDSVQMAGSRGAHSTLPPLSQEEQLTIAAQVNEFWRMLPLSAKSDPEYAAIHTRAAAVRARCSTEAGQQPLAIGQLLSAIEPSVAEMAALKIQTGWRQRQRRRAKDQEVLGRFSALSIGRGGSMAQVCALAFGSCGCAISRRLIS